MLYAGSPDPALGWINPTPPGENRSESNQLQVNSTLQPTKLLSLPDFPPRAQLVALKLNEDGNLSPIQGSFKGCASEAG